jgi:hypothetical protein
VPFALGYVYEHTFSGSSGWTFDPGIFGTPFFPGSGFVGVKYLKSPVNPATGAQVGLTLFSNTINGGAFDDAQNTVQLYRYLSGNISVPAGDAACNNNPQTDKICYVNTGAPADMRFFQSSGPLTLAPGEFQSIVVAYIFAAPVATSGCPAAGACDLTPGDPTRTEDLAALTSSAGLNPVDSVAGYLGFGGDANSNGVPEQSEYNLPVSGSLMGKALTAQSVFDFTFLLPFAPDPPEFFTVPGDNEVSVIWRQSPTEASGDPFFTIASQVTITDTLGNPLPNPLYDPNYRQFDVEGYRVYRGRVDNPNELQMLAQFDYTGTFISDFAGQVNPTAGCAPELGVNVFTPILDTLGQVVDSTPGCPVVFDTVVPGLARTVHNDIPLVGPITQTKLTGGRNKLATGEAIFLQVDTAFTGAGGSGTTLEDTGVPFIFVDKTARNNLRYFYSVVAFDVNSFQSGPSSLESPRNTKSTTPSHTAANAQSTLQLTQAMVGRGQTLDYKAPAPALDPANLTFSGPFPPANGWEIGFVSSLSQVLSGTGSFSAKLDSMSLGNAWEDPTSTYFFTATTAGGALTVSVPVAQDFVEPTGTGTSTPFLAATVDQSAARFGGSNNFSLYGQVTMTLPGWPYTNGFGRIVALGAQTAGFPELNVENGSRWFDGANETTAHPNANNAADPTADPLLYSNAGTLAGVTLIHEPEPYLQGYPGASFRELPGAYSAAARAADFKFYWGTGGAVDSVIDITHNVPVPFDSSFGASWGFLTPASATSNLSIDASTALVSTADFWCVDPAIAQGATGDQTCASDPPYKLVPVATLAPIAAGGTDPVVPITGQQGFGLYMPGHAFIFGMPALPAAGTVWTLRTYTGAITADNTFFEQPRPLTAVGVEVQAQYQATNQLVAATDDDLSRVHTVPDPYYVTNQFEQTTDTKIIKFVNLPSDCIIRIYSSSGVLVTLLEHHNSQGGGAEDWNVRNRNNQVVASGVYFYHVESGDARRVGRFTIVNFAE